ncbi:MAG: hypothetical protein ACEPO8_05245 [Rhodothermaceae bacterium]
MLYKNILNSSLRQSTHKVWVILSFAISLLFFGMNIVSENNITEITIFSIKMNRMIANNGEIWISYLIYVICFLTIITTPKLLLDLMHKKSVHFVLGKSFSRIDLLTHTSIGIITSYYIFSLLTGVLILLGLYISNGILSFSFLLTCLYIPIILFGIFIIQYIAILVFENYSMSVAVGFFYILVFSPMLELREKLFSDFSEILLNILNVLYELLPQTLKFINLAAKGNDISGEQLTTLSFLIISYFPLLAYCVYLMRKKEF